MEINFNKTFFKSIKKLAWHNSLLYKAYELFRYDIPYFFKNIYRFKKALWNYRSWSYDFSLYMLKTSLEFLKESIENGNEIEESRNKKVNAIERTIELLDHFHKDSFIELAEKQLGKEVILKDFEFKPIENKPDLFEMIDNLTEDENKINSEIFQLARDIEKNEWDELWSIIKGKLDYSLFETEEYKNMTLEQKEEYYNSIFDGTHMMGWWN